MNNIKQLLNKENWLKYLKLADEGGLTYNAKANDIVSKIEQAINYTRCCTELKTEQECYKTGKTCMYKCKGLCKDAC